MIAMIARTINSSSRENPSFLNLDVFITELGMAA